MNETELLFCNLLGLERHELYFKKNYLLPKDKGRFIAQALRRRMQAEPLEYILGCAYFFGEEFIVNKNVFIPRPETEILVETTLRLIDKLKQKPVSILELGTGSGCIAISIAKFAPHTQIIATDISHAALAVAKENALRHKVIERIDFVNCDLFDGLKAKFDLIISNPPYIASSQIKKLQREIQFEPRIALDGGASGLEFYSRIIKYGGIYLSTGGFLVLELGFAQVKAVKNILGSYPELHIMEIIKDYAEIERVLVVRKESKNG